VRVGKLTIRFRRRPRRKLGAVAPVSSMVFAGLRSLGRQHATEARIRHLRDELKPADRRRLRRDLPRAPAWMHPLLRFLTAEEPRRRARRRGKSVGRLAASGAGGR